ncbi:hypothetical protein CcaverHIS002_0401820 [Cutaneotrichosporon cavernicola]|nr:hypothetical protein CcaverHIS002_0401820 [Cutaneotrichosporon cavernicola]
MLNVRRVQASLHLALIGLAIPYVWLNTVITIADAKNTAVAQLVYALSGTGWLLLFAIVIYMSKRDADDVLAFSWKDRIALACAFIHGTISNLAIRQEKGYTMIAILSLMCTLIFGVLCIGTVVIDLVRWKSDDEDDGGEGLIMDGGEEGNLTLTQTPRIQWPHFYNSSRLKIYRLAGAASLVLLAGVTESVMSASFLRLGRVFGTLMLILLSGSSVALSLVINGPKGGDGTNQYYSLAKVALGASNILFISLIVEGGVHVYVTVSMLIADSPRQL